MRNIPTKALKAVITNDKDEILLLQRNPKTRKQDNWDLPGGLLEEGEDEKSALEREVKEELDVEIEIVNIGKVWNFFRPLDGKIVNVQNYVSKIVNGTIKLSDEHINYEWVNKKNINKYPVKDDSLFDALR